ncbi:MAG: alpha-L-fucosidase [Chloroflexota bacterium]
MRRSPAIDWPADAGDLSWFTAARFGLFVHWGAYSSGRDCWMQSREQIDAATYRERYVRTFTPDLYDPADWAERAWDAGMRYVVITTKHHDGLCLWDSGLTEYTVARTAPGRDLLRPFIDAFRARGFRIGLYYSLLDWDHPGFTVDALHPLRGNESARGRPADMAAYRSYIEGQIRELLTGYGRIDYVWFDFSYPAFEDPAHPWATGKGPADWGSERLEALVRSLQPAAILNDRLGLGRGIRTPEQNVPDDRLLDRGRPVAWELCHTENESWGYHRDDLRLKTPTQVVEMLVETVARGGNLLFNIGPTSRGEFSQHSRQLLRGVGAWMRCCEPAIRGAGPSPLAAPPNCRYTQRGDRLYVHVFTWGQHLRLPGLAGRVRSARTLHDGSEVVLAKPRLHPGADDDLVIELPTRPDILVPVIEVDLTRPEGRVDA